MKGFFDNSLFMALYSVNAFYFLARCVFSANTWEFTYSIGVALMIFSAAFHALRKRNLEALSNGLAAAASVAIVTLFNFMNIETKIENVLYLFFVMLVLGVRNMAIFGESESESGGPPQFLNNSAAMMYLQLSLFLPIIYAINDCLELAYVSFMSICLILSFHFNLTGKSISESKSLLFMMVSFIAMLLDNLMFDESDRLLSSYFLIACMFLVIGHRYFVLEKTLAKRNDD